MDPTVTSSGGRNLGRAHVLVGGFVAVAAAAYLVARAVNVPLTYDEASSFLRYVDDEPAALFDFATATNHFLNSVLTRLSRAALGSAPWALRLPNVLAGFGYLACVVAIAIRTRHPAVGVAGLALLGTNPYLLDYLSLSRGYGISIALITGATYVLVRWCDRPSASAASRRDLALGLGMAVAAVAASFAVLPAFLALVALAVVRLAWEFRFQAGPVVENVRSTMWSWRHVAAWVLITTAFTAAVFARERALSEKRFLPITVRVAGLFEEELAGIQVFRFDTTGRLRDLTRRAGGVWSTGPVHDAYSLRVALPAAADRNLASLDLRMGADVYRRDRREPGPWRVEESGNDRVLVASDALKWRGAAAHWRLVAIHTAVTLGVLALFGAGLALLSRALIRARVVGGEDARSVVAAILGVASVAAAPLYLLQRNGQLFFGGSSGLMADTFGSLVAGTAYGVEYHPAQAGVALIAFGVAVAGLLLVLLLGSRARRDGAFRSAVVVLAVIALAAVQTSLQHLLLGTPYPTGRTALYLLPLLLMFLVFLADALATLGRASRVVVTTVMLILAAGSAWNGWRAANVSRTLDWPADSSTAEMLGLVAASDSGEHAVPGVVRIGVDWVFYPVARYYAERQSSADTRHEVIVLPGDGLPFDFVYAAPSSDAATGAVLRRFPESDAVLWRVDP